MPVPRLLRGQSVDQNRHAPRMNGSATASKVVSGLVVAATTRDPQNLKLRRTELHLLCFLKLRLTNESRLLLFHSRSRSS